MTLFAALSAGAKTEVFTLSFLSFSVLLLNDLVAVCINVDV